MIRNIRLWSGLILLVFVISHLANHALLLISIDTANGGLAVFEAVWRSIPGQVIISATFIAHLAIALWSLYKRQTLRMHPWEWIQLVLGFAIPFQLFAHFIGTAYIAQEYGTLSDYYYILWVFWIASPLDGILQSVILVVAWGHAAIGIHFWLRLKPWYRSWAPWLLVFAIALPMLALLGVNHGGREIETFAKDKVLLNELIASFKLPSGKDFGTLLSIIDWSRIGMVALLVGVLAARIIRNWTKKFRGVVQISYPAGRIAAAQPGMTILDVSRLNGIPHAAVCGGRGRCSTCRIRVGAGAEFLAAPDTDEKRVLDRVGSPENVRLACQIRPTNPLQVTPLLPATAPPAEAYARPSHIYGQDQEIAILFADLRSFTKFSESKLPYDVVFVLNRYFTAMGQAVAGAGGHLDKFIGDGVMALFGIGKDPQRGAQDALAAAKAMSLNLQELNDTLAHDLEEPLRIGIGVHMGPAIIGEMGYGRATSLTAIGDSVNTASRLEAMTKELGVQLVVSQVLADRSGVDLSGYAEENVSIRGRKGSLAVRVVKDASTLPDPPSRKGQSDGKINPPKGDAVLEIPPLN
jgi:adenylate cyclase